MTVDHPGIHLEPVEGIVGHLHDVWANTSPDDACTEAALAIAITRALAELFEWDDEDDDCLGTGFFAGDLCAMLHKRNGNLVDDTEDAS